VLFGAAGCSKARESSSAPDSAATPASASPALSREETLAFADVKGDSTVDRELRAAQELAKKNPTSDAAWINLGHAWVKEARGRADPGYYLHARACAAIVLARAPDDRLALDLEGLVLMNQHAFEDARTLAERITRAHPDDAMAWGTLSDALLEVGRYDDAEAAVDRMVALKPGLASYVRASHLRWLRGDLEAAKRHARSAIDAGRGARDPEPHAWTLCHAATIFLHEGDLDGADVGYEQALGRVSEYPCALVGRGRIALAKKDAARAADLFARAAAVEPTAETLWLLGDAFAAKGDEAKANEAYARVEQEESRDARTVALYYAVKNKRVDHALALARSELEKRKDIYTEEALAWALFRNGKNGEAKEAITRARRLGTRDARLMAHEGRIRIANGDASGRALVEKALATSPAFWDAAETREALARR
jgi:tetratricopeptide (TPR) repeat protein